MIVYDNHKQLLSRAHTLPLCAVYTHIYRAHSVYPAWSEKIPLKIIMLIGIDSTMELETATTV